MLESYTEALIKEIHQWGGKFNNRPIDTLYLGGGTPSLLAHRLPRVKQAVKSAFNLLPNAEITLEFNPSDNAQELLEYAKIAGVNRLSIGAQSGIDRELEALGRAHSAKDTENTVQIARSLGFNNISLDIMLALPDSTNATLSESLEFIAKLSPEHISAYMLKIEERTAFYSKQSSLKLPDDDSAAEQYLSMSSFFEKSGFEHYEISNFCKKGKESRHNLKYWQGKDYLGIGPAAHSFINGNRFYYPRDLKGFIAGNKPLPDGIGGGKEEYIMLKLRLATGISAAEYKLKFGKSLPQSLLEHCHRFKTAGFMAETQDGFCLTNKGMLLSNTIISQLLECLE